MDVKLKGLAFVIYINAETQIFDLTFPVLREEDLHVYVNGIEVEHEWISPSQIKVLVNVSTSDEILLLRTTKQDERYIDFKDAGLLRMKYMDQNSDQLFFLIQEALDWKFMVPSYNPELGGINVFGQRVLDAAPAVHEDDLVVVSQLGPVVAVTEQVENILDPLEPEIVTQTNRLNAFVGDSETTLQEVDSLLEGIEEHLDSTSEHGADGDIIGTLGEQIVVDKTLVGAKFVNMVKLEPTFIDTESSESQYENLPDGALVYVTSTDEIKKVYQKKLFPVEGGFQPVDRVTTMSLIPDTDTMLPLTALENGKSQLVTLVISSPTVTHSRQIRRTMFGDVVTSGTFNSVGTAIGTYNISSPAGISINMGSGVDPWTVTYTVTTV